MFILLMTRQYIGAHIITASLSNAKEKKPTKSKFVHYTRCEFDLYCPSTHGATFCEYIDTGMLSPCTVFADRICPAMPICQKMAQLIRL